MSEFSEKLSRFISQSGYNVYQLAKEASLDRTTLQKTVKGQRLPSLDYIRDICRYIKISDKQEEELYRLYHMEKLGRGMVEAWDEITNMLADIRKLRKKTQAGHFLDIYFGQQSLKEFSKEKVQPLSSEMDTIKVILCMMEQEITEEDTPEIYMDVSWASEYALEQLQQEENRNDKRIVCHQLVRLRSTEQSKDGMADNFRILHQVLPYAFSSHMEYDVRYAYFTGAAEESRCFLWPHYIVTHKHVFLYSDETHHAVLLSDEQTAQCYRSELEQIVRNYRPLFTYQGFSGDGIQLYRRMFENGRMHMTYEEFPCIALMIPQEVQEQLKADETIGAYAQAFFEQPEVAEDQFINIFGMQGMKHFIQTGHFPGIFDRYIKVQSVIERRRMVENFHQHLLAHTRRFYMINEEKFAAGGDYGIEQFDQKKVVFCSVSTEFPFGFISIDEPGMCHVFSVFFENLLETDFVYSVEETIVRYEEMVEEYFREVEDVKKDVEG